MKEIEVIKKIEREYRIKLENISLTQDWSSPNGYSLDEGKITGLKLCGVRLKEFPLEILKLSNLNKLYLWANNLFKIPDLDNLSKLVDLDLSGNNLSNLSFIKGLSNLESLDLSGNKISNVIDLRDLKSLKTLKLDSNEIESTSILRELTNLKELQISENKITDLSDIGKITSLITLDLNENGIVDISPLENLKVLKYLSIHANEISDLRPLSNLISLTKLEIWSNEISDISDLMTLTNLENLDLWGNKINNIEPLSKLKKIKSLDISNNYIEDVAPISQLNNIEELSLSKNPVKNVSELSNCKKLKRLSINENKIQNIDFLENCIELNFLSSNNNKISNISALSKLKSLENIALSNNEIEDLTPICSLLELKELTLSNNNISDISILKSNINLLILDLSNNDIGDISAISLLDKLKKLDLRNNNITQLPLWLIESGLENFESLRDKDLPHRYFRHEAYIEGYSVKGNPIENVPIELLSEDNESIKDYFKSLEKGSKPINEIKVILLGEGAAGKTSLMNILKGKKYIKGQPQTHGINLEECYEPNGVTLKVWDFGGQDIMHHTHQFFLTQKSIYILVLNARENTDTEKWLKLIQVFGGDSPIIIVTNKIDENPSDHENIKYLNTKYPNIKNRYVRISCEKSIGLNEFKSLLSETIKGILHVRTLWGYSWLGVKQELEEMRNGESLKDYIHFEKYEEICDKHEVAKSHRQTLINWLHQLGVITYFPDNILNETNVINPSWLTEAFYKIINAKVVAENFGRFQIKQLHLILDPLKYPKYKYNYLVELMTKFELCYKIDDNNYLIPDLLNKEEPEFKFNFKEALKFKIKYSNLLPKAILPKFMVRRHPEIKLDVKWRTGLLIMDPHFDSEALIRVDNEDKEIAVYVVGEGKRGYLSSIISNLESINSLYEGLEREKLVPCICASCQELEKPFYFKYEILKKLKIKGRRTHTCEISTDDVSINDLLGILITNEDLQNEISTLVGRGSFQTKKFIEEGNIDGFITTVKSLFSSVSYLLFEKSEKAYHTPLFLLLRSVFSSNAHADEIQAKGRADIIINIQNFLYILELKLDGSANEALDQIHLNKYYEPYIIEKKKIILVGINFSSKERNIVDYCVEILKL